MNSVAGTTLEATTDRRPSPKSRPPDASRPMHTEWSALVVAAAVAASPIAQGYFDFQVWGAIELALLALIVVLLLAHPATVGGSAATAAVGLGLLLALSAASSLWAESKEAVWTDTNRLALYCAVFALVVGAVKDRRTPRLIMLALGSAALITSLALCGAMLVGAARGYFPGHRLDWPIGYVNADAGLLVMGIWPWVGLAETAKRGAIRALALGAASLIAGCLVLTQSRAMVPAALAATILVLACAPRRTRRALNLILVGAAVAAGLTWTLRVYSTGGAALRSFPPGQMLLRDAAIAIVASALGAALVQLALSRWIESFGAERARRTERRLGMALVAVAAALLVAGAVVAAPSISRRVHSFTSMRSADTASIRILDAGGYRYDLWRVAAKEFERHPIAGLGAGNYDVEYYRLRRNPEYVLQPHSLELQMAAELGIGGIVALLLFCGAIGLAAFSTRGTFASSDRLVKVGASGMFAAWLAGTSVDWLYDIPGLTGMAMIAAALLVVRPPGAPRRMGGARRAVWAPIGVGVIVLGAAAVGRQYAASQYAQLGTADVRRAPRAALSPLGDAIALDPYSLSSRYALAAAYARQDDYPDARASLLAAAAREPHNFTPPALLGDLAMRRGSFSAAASEYARALALNPRDPTIRAALTRARRAR